MRFVRAALLVTIAALPQERSLAQSTDYNGLGLQAYQRKDFAEAVSLFTKAIEKDPKLAFAWLNKGRAIAVMNALKPPEDYCDADSNWIFLALAHLNEAMTLEPKAVGEEIRADASDFAKFKETAEFQLWWTAVSPLPTSDRELRAFFRANPVWNRESDATPVREGLTLRREGRIDLFSGGETRSIGTWHIRSGKIVFATGKKTETYSLNRRDFFIREGTLRFAFLQLGDRWTMGRILSDCGF